MNVAYCSEYKEDPAAQFSEAMMEIAIKHNNIVISECEDEKIKEKAIWNAMVCCGNMNKYDEGERLLRKVLSSAQNEQDVDLVKSCLGSLVMLLVELNRMSEAKELYEKEMGPSIGEDYGSSSFMGTLATLYASAGDFVKAESYLERGWKRAMNHTDSITMYLSSSEVRDLSNNRNVAYQDLLKGVSL
jgi:tetratricopeptide (TPR) repeat protein